VRQTSENDDGGRPSLSAWLFAVLIIVVAVWCLGLLRSMHEVRLDWRRNVALLSDLQKVGSDIEKLAMDQAALTPGTVRSLSHRFLAVVRAAGESRNEDVAMQTAVRAAQRAAMRAVEIAARGAGSPLEVKERVQGLMPWVGDVAARLRAADDHLGMVLEAETRSLYGLGAASMGLAVLNMGFLLAWRTRRRKAAQALAAQRRADASFRALIEAAPEVIIVAQEGLVRYANSAAVKALGHASAATLVGRREDELTVPPDRLDEDVPRVAAPLPSEDSPDELSLPRPVREMRLRRADGTAVPSEVLRLGLVFDGQPSTVTIARDVSERRRMQSLLLIAERMASVGTLAAGVGHEINNPLAYVLSNLECLVPLARQAAAGQPIAARDGQDMVDLVQETREGAERIRHIVADLKAFSRADGRPPGPVDLERVIDLAARMASVEIRHRARLVRNIASMPPVRAEEGRLAQVFLNLLVNAAQSIREGAAAGNQICVTARAAGGFVVVEVADTGCGIAPEHLDKVFDPFFTTKPIGQGTGLGLAFCHNTVQQLGGSITVTSEPGLGSKFTITLPVATENELAEGAASEPAAVTGPEAPRGRILAVDDEPLVGRTLKRLLERKHDIEIVLSAREATARIEAGPPYDVILLDLTMPEMSGIDLHEEILRRHPQLAPAVVFMTGGAFTSAAREYLERVKVPLLGKPFNWAELERVIAERTRGNEAAA
jgi:PAS domain S-box-containing protein